MKKIIIFLFLFIIPLGKASAKEAPQEVKAIYLTGSSAGNSAKINYVLNLAKEGAINSVVIDIKDYSGYVFYNTSIKEALDYKARKIKIMNIESLLEKLHKENIYAIGRIVVFQDPVLAKARPDLAIQTRNNSLSFLALLASIASLWLDNLKLAWMDPASEQVWDYNINIANEALGKGFDEINLDYVRFPSDGDLSNMSFPVWNGKEKKSDVIKRFFQEARKEIKGTISVDIFGQTTIEYGDMGIGQKLEDAFSSFDYVCPMVYPSHYAKGFIGFSNPAEHPYQVVFYSISSAKKRLASEAKIRPWLQDFSMGAWYNYTMVGNEIQAVKDSLKEGYNGFMLWNSMNIYNKQALKDN